MDARQFDDLVSRLASLPNRRDAILGFSGGVLAAAGLVEAAEGKRKSKGKNKNKNKKRKKGRGRIGVEACIPTGKKCPSPKPRGNKGKRLGCNRCCQQKSIRRANGKRKCVCRIAGDPCTADTAFTCCSGVCAGNVCQESAVTTVGPTTAGPTTQAPTTTAAPTTQPPTSEPPTSEPPTSEPPTTTTQTTTIAPTTTQTTTIAPTTVQPTTTLLP